MQINVSSNIKDITKDLSRYQKDQIPFAASQTINQLATRLSFDVLPQKTTEVFQGGAVPFTQKGFRYKRSNKRNLIATVFIDPARAKYMQFMVQGGTRFPDKRAILVATSQSKLNKYGNIPRGTLQDMIQNKTKFFNGIPKGKQGSNYEGIWERYGRKTGKNAGQRIRMVARYEDKAEYKPLFPFGTFVRDVVFSRNDGFAKLFRTNLNRAIASKR